MATRYRRRMLRENNYRSTYIMSANVINMDSPYLFTPNDVSKANQLHPLIRFTNTIDGNSIDQLIDIEISIKNKNLLLDIYKNFFNYIYLLFDLLMKPDVADNIDQIISYANFIVNYINNILLKLKKPTDDIGIDILDKARDVIITIIEDISRTTNFTITNYRIDYLNDVINETKYIIENGISEENV